MKREMTRMRSGREANSRGAGWARALALATLLAAASGCVDLNNPNPSSSYGSPYSYSGQNSYGHDNYRRREYERTRAERRDLEREQDRLAAERRRLEEERRRIASVPPPPPPQRREHCPAGFSPSERKCTQQERRNGCKDIRLPGGLGCVNR